MGRCIGWAFDGPVIARHYPQFIGWARKQRSEKQPDEKPRDEQKA
jgi:hypothetical protein